MDRTQREAMYQRMMHYGWLAPVLCKHTQRPMSWCYLTDKGLRAWLKLSALNMFSSWEARFSLEAHASAHQTGMFHDATWARRDRAIKTLPFLQVAL